jgi:hypothetical protein
MEDSHSRWRTCPSNDGLSIGSFDVGEGGHCVGGVISPEVASMRPDRVDG